jgi:hypothetical protein
MFEALKSLSPKQRFLGFIIVVLISAITSLGTAYMSGSDCTEISDKYTKSIENYNKLIEITDETQQKYLDAKKDIIVIQDKLEDIYIILGQRNQTTTKNRTSNEEIEIFVNEKSTSNNGEVMTTGPRPKENKVIEKVVITKTESPKEAFGMIDSLLQITKKYEKKK